ncbi:hypothetical protein, partial [Mesorhizobium sp. B2-7-1]|uniref:hypothetical protein n=1 Tax=Mesorhizobium sp. B2-7-1 TaxID=2589909 RepID=UPI001AEEEAFB
AARAAAISKAPVYLNRLTFDKSDRFRVYGTRSADAGRGRPKCRAAFSRKFDKAIPSKRRRMP